MNFVAWGLWFQFWVVLLTLWAGTLIIGWSYVDRDSPMIHRCTRWWGQNLLRVAHIPVEVEGLEHLVPGQAYVFAANHRSNFDIFALVAVLPGRFLWVAKKSLFNVPFMGWHMRRSGYIPIDRENPREAARSIIEAARIIRAGVNAIAFPEGTRSRTGDIGQFRSGAFALALRAGVPLVPITLEGSYRVIMPKTLQVNPGTIIRIKIEKPIDLSAYDKADRHRLMDELFGIMSRNLDELRSRRRPDEERADPVFRWIYGRSGRPDYDSLRSRAGTPAQTTRT